MDKNLLLYLFEKTGRDPKNLDAFIKEAQGNPGIIKSLYSEAGGDPKMFNEFLSDLGVSEEDFTNPKETVESIEKQNSQSPAINKAPKVNKPPKGQVNEDMLTYLFEKAEGKPSELKNFLQDVKDNPTLLKRTYERAGGDMSQFESFQQEVGIEGIPNPTEPVTTPPPVPKKKDKKEDNRPTPLEEALTPTNPVVFGDKKESTDTDGKDKKKGSAQDNMMTIFSPTPPIMPSMKPKLPTQSVLAISMSEEDKQKAAQALGVIPSIPGATPVPSIPDFYRADNALGDLRASGRLNSDVVEDETGRRVAIRNGIDFQRQKRAAVGDQEYVALKSKRPTVAEWTVDGRTRMPEGSITHGEYKQNLADLGTDNQELNDALRLVVEELRVVTQTDEPIQEMVNLNREASLLREEIGDNTPTQDQLNRANAIEERRNKLFGSEKVKDLVDEFNKIYTLLDANAKTFTSIMKSDDYAYARSIEKEMDQRQLRADELNRDYKSRGLRGKLGLTASRLAAQSVVGPKEGVSNVSITVAKTAARVLGAIGTLEKMKESEGLTAQVATRILNPYKPLTDLVQEGMRRVAPERMEQVDIERELLIDTMMSLSEDLEEAYPMSTNRKRSPNSLTLEIDPVKFNAYQSDVMGFLPDPEYASTMESQFLDVDREGNILGFYDEDGYLLPNALVTPMLEDFVSENLGEAKHQWNRDSFVQTLTDTLLDLGVQIMVMKGMGAGASLSKVGNMAINTVATAGLMMEGQYEQGLELFDGDENKAMDYAIASGVAIGASSNIFGLEVKLAGGGSQGLKLGTQKLSNKTMQNLVNRTAGNPIILAGLTSGINAAGETIEEAGIEPLINMGVSWAMGGEAELPDLQETKVTAAIAFATGLIGGVPSIPGEVAETRSRLYARSVEAAIGDIPQVREQLKALIDAGKVTVPSRDNTEVTEEQKEAYVNYIANRLEFVKGYLEEVELDPDERHRIIPLLESKYSVEQALGSLEGTAPKIMTSRSTKTKELRAKLDKINEGINTVLGDTKESVDNLAQLTPEESLEERVYEEPEKKPEAPPAAAPENIPATPESSVEETVEPAAPSSSDVNKELVRLNREVVDPDQDTGNVTYSIPSSKRQVVVVTDENGDSKYYYAKKDGQPGKQEVKGKKSLQEIQEAVARNEERTTRRNEIYEQLGQGDQGIESDFEAEFRKIEQAESDEELAMAVARVSNKVDQGAVLSPSELLELDKKRRELRAKGYYFKTFDTISKGERAFVNTNSLTIVDRNNASSLTSEEYDTLERELNSFTEQNPETDLSTSDEKILLTETVSPLVTKDGKVIGYGDVKIKEISVSEAVEILNSRPSTPQAQPTTTTTTTTTTTQPSRPPLNREQDLALRIAVEDALTAPTSSLNKDGEMERFQRTEEQLLEELEVLENKAKNGTLTGRDVVNSSFDRALTKENAVLGQVFSEGNIQTALDGIRANLNARIENKKKKEEDKATKEAEEKAKEDIIAKSKSEVKALFEKAFGVRKGRVTNKIFQRVMDNVAKRMGMTPEQLRERVTVAKSTRNSEEGLRGIVDGMDNRLMFDYSDAVEVKSQGGLLENVQDVPAAVLDKVYGLENDAQGKLLYRAMSLFPDILNTIKNTEGKKNTSLRSVANKLQQEISQLYKDGKGSEADPLKEQLKKLKEEIKESEKERKPFTIDSINKLLSEEITKLAVEVATTDKYVVTELSDAFIEFHLSVAKKANIQKDIDKWENLKTDKEERASKIRHQQYIQKNIFALSFDYLAGNKDYPIWFQAIALKEVLTTTGKKEFEYDKNGAVVKDNEGNRKVKGVNIYTRNNYTFGEPQVISSGNAYSIMEDILNGEPLSIPELIIKHDEKTYISDTAIDEYIEKYRHKDRPNGTWIKIPANGTDADVEALYSLTRESHRDGGKWCTGGSIGMANSHNSEGDFYLFIDKENKVRLAARFEDGKMAESMKGNLDGQGVEPELLEESNWFMTNTEGAYEFLKNVRFSEFYNKYENNNSLDKEDVKELIEVIDSGDGSFNSERNKEKKERLSELLQNNIAVIADVYNLGLDQIHIGNLTINNATENKEQLHEGLSLVVGSLKVEYDLEGPVTGFPNLRVVTGSVQISGRGYMDFPLLETIGRSLVINSTMEDVDAEFSLHFGALKSINYVEISNSNVSFPVLQSFDDFKVENSILDLEEIEVINRLEMTSSSVSIPNTREIGSVVIRGRNSELSAPKASTVSFIDYNAYSGDSTGNFVLFLPKLLRANVVNLYGVPEDSYIDFAYGPKISELNIGESGSLENNIDLSDISSVGKLVINNSSVSLPSIHSVDRLSIEGSLNVNLRQLEKVGDLEIKDSEKITLPRLNYVGGSFTLESDNIKLPKLSFIYGGSIIDGTNIEMPSLHTTGSSLHLRGNNISFPKLKTIKGVTTIQGSDIDLRKLEVIEGSPSYTNQLISDSINLENLRIINGRIEFSGIIDLPSLRSIDGDLYTYMPYNSYKEPSKYALNTYNIKDKRFNAPNLERVNGVVVVSDNMISYTMNSLTTVDGIELIEGANLSLPSLVEIGSNGLIVHEGSSLTSLDSLMVINGDTYINSSFSSPRLVEIKGRLTINKNAEIVKLNSLNYVINSDSIFDSSEEKGRGTIYVPDSFEGVESLRIGMTTNIVDAEASYEDYIEYKESGKGSVLSPFNSPEAIQDVYDNPGKYGFHGGSLIGRGDRNTGKRVDKHFTGSFFFSDMKRALERGSSRMKVGMGQIARAVDFTKYNLIKFKKGDDYWKFIGQLDGIISTLDKNNYENVDDFNRILNKVISSSIFGESPLSVLIGRGEEVIDLWNKYVQDVEEIAKKPDDFMEFFPTRLLEYIGYEGIDARNLKGEDGSAAVDNRMHGSVIFKVKPNTVVTITPGEEDQKLLKELNEQYKTPTGTAWDPIKKQAGRAFIAIDRIKNKYLVFLGKDADITSPLHEVAHLYEEVLTEEEIAKILEWSGEKEWNREASEKFARGFEKFLYDNKVDDTDMQNIFNKFAKWMKALIEDAITYFKGVPELNDDMIGIYNAMVATDVNNFVDSKVPEVTTEGEATKVITDLDDNTNRTEDETTLLQKAKELILGRRANTQPKGFSQELFNKIKQKLQTLYPEIMLRIEKNPIWQTGFNVFNQREKNKKAYEALVAYFNEVDSDFTLDDYLESIGVDPDDDLRVGRLGGLEYLDVSVDEYGDVLSDKEKARIALAQEIYDNYANAMGRTSDYRGPLRSIILDGRGKVYRPFKSRNNNSALVGRTMLDDIFVVSHFAPSSLREGVNLIKAAAEDSMPVIMAVPEYQANQLAKAGFRQVAVIPQYFNGEMVMKQVMVNDATSDQDIQNLMEHFSQNYNQQGEGGKIIGQANIQAMGVLIDAVNQGQDTLPHEYAHHYIAWYRDSELVQQAIEKFGSEEALVDAIGKEVVNREGEAFTWWEQFKEWVIDKFVNIDKRSAEDLTGLLADAFLTGKEIGKPDFKEYLMEQNQRKKAVETVTELNKKNNPTRKEKGALNKAREVLAGILPKKRAADPDQALFDELVELFQKLYPEIDLNILMKPKWESGEGVFNHLDNAVADQLNDYFDKLSNFLPASITAVKVKPIKNSNGDLVYLHNGKEYDALGQTLRKDPKYGDYLYFMNPTSSTTSVQSNILVPLIKEIVQTSSSSVSSNIDDRTIRMYMQTFANFTIDRFLKEREKIDDDILEELDYSFLSLLLPATGTPIKTIEEAFLRYPDLDNMGIHEFLSRTYNGEGLSVIDPEKLAKIPETTQLAFSKLAQDISKVFNLGINISDTINKPYLLSGNQLLLNPSVLEEPASTLLTDIITENIIGSHRFSEKEKQEPQLKEMIEAIMEARLGGVSPTDIDSEAGRRVQELISQSDPDYARTFLDKVGMFIDEMLNKLLSYINPNYTTKEAIVYRKTLKDAPINELLSSLAYNRVQPERNIFLARRNAPWVSLSNVELIGGRHYNKPSSIGTVQEYNDAGKQIVHVLGAIGNKYTRSESFDFWGTLTDGAFDPLSCAIQTKGNEVDRTGHYDTATVVLKPSTEVLGAFGYDSYTYRNKPYEMNYEKGSPLSLEESLALEDRKVANKVTEQDKEDYYPHDIQKGYSEIIVRFQPQFIKEVTYYGPKIPDALINLQQQYGFEVKHVIVEKDPSKGDDRQKGIRPVFQGYNAELEGKNVTAKDIVDKMFTPALNNLIKEGKVTPEKEAYFKKEFERFIKDREGQNGDYIHLIDNNFRDKLMGIPKHLIPKSISTKSGKNTLHAAKLIMELKIPISGRVIPASNQDMYPVYNQMSEGQIIGQANIEAMTVLIDALRKKLDTLPHEYAHHYIAWYRESEMVQNGIKEFGSEEALVDAIGKAVIERRGKAFNWWEKFSRWVLAKMGKIDPNSQEEILKNLTNAFLTREEIGKANMPAKAAKKEALKDPNNPKKKVRQVLEDKIGQTINQELVSKVEKNLQKIAPGVRILPLNAKEYKKATGGEKAPALIDYDENIIYVNTDIATSNNLYEEAAHVAINQSLSNDKKIEIAHLLEAELMGGNIEERQLAAELSREITRYETKSGKGVETRADEFLAKLAARMLTNAPNLRPRKKERIKRKIKNAIKGLIGIEPKLDNYTEAIDFIQNIATGVSEGGLNSPVNSGKSTGRSYSARKDASQVMTEVLKSEPDMNPVDLAVAMADYGYVMTPRQAFNHKMTMIENGTIKVDPDTLKNDQETILKEDKDYANVLAREPEVTRSILDYGDKLSKALDSVSNQITNKALSDLAKLLKKAVKAGNAMEVASITKEMEPALRATSFTKEANATLKNSDNNPTNLTTKPFLGKFAQRAKADETIVKAQEIRSEVYSRGQAPTEQIESGNTYQTSGNFEYGINYQINELLQEIGYDGLPLHEQKNVDSIIQEAIALTDHDGSGYIAQVESGMLGVSGPAAFVEAALSGIPITPAQQAAIGIELQRIIRSRAQKEAILVAMKADPKYRRSDIQKMEDNIYNDNREIFNYSNALKRAGTIAGQLLAFRRWTNLAQGLYTADWMRQQAREAISGTSGILRELTPEQEEAIEAIIATKQAAEARIEKLEEEEQEIATTVYENRARQYYEDLKANTRSGKANKTSFRERLFGRRRPRTVVEAIRVYGELMPSKQIMRQAQEIEGKAGSISGSKRRFDSVLEELRRIANLAQHEAVTKYAQVILDAANARKEALLAKDDDASTAEALELENTIIPEIESILNFAEKRLDKTKGKSNTFTRNVALLDLVGFYSSTNETVDDVVDALRADYPDMFEGPVEDTKRKVLDSLLDLNEKKVAEKIIQLKARKKNIVSAKEGVDSLRELLTELDRTYDSQTSLNNWLQERLGKIEDSIKSIQVLLSESSPATPEETHQSYQKLQEINGTLSDLTRGSEGTFNTNDAQAKVRQAIRSLGMMEKYMRIDGDNATTRAAELDSRVAALTQPDPDLSAMFASQNLDRIDPLLSDEELTQIRLARKSLSGDLKAALTRVNKLLTQKSDETEVFTREILTVPTGRSITIYKESLKLPNNLRKSRPKYKDSKITFDDDLAKAIYIVGGKGKSKYHDEYVQWLKDNYGEDTDWESLGENIRQSIEEQYEKGERDFKIAAPPAIQRDDVGIDQIIGETLDIKIWTVKVEKKGEDYDLPDELLSPEERIEKERLKSVQEESKRINTIISELNSIINLRKSVNVVDMLRLLKELGDLINKYPEVVGGRDNADKLLNDDEKYLAEHVIRMIEENKKIDKENSLDAALERLQEQFEAKKEAIINEPKRVAALELDEDSFRFVRVTQLIRDQQKVVDRERERFDRMVKDFRRKAAVESKPTKIGRIAARTVLNARDYYEILRSVVYMGDASYLFNQLYPYIIKHGGDFSVRRGIEAFKDSDEKWTKATWEAFRASMPNFQAVHDLIKIGTVQVAGSHLKNWGKTKQDRRQFTEDLMLALIDDPFYRLFRDAGLELITPGKIEYADEMWKSDFDRYKITGGFLSKVRDISEDTMTVSLNIARMQMMKEYYLANPRATMADLTNYATLVNLFTGRGSSKKEGSILSKGIGIASTIASAPRLLLSKLYLGTAMLPMQIAGYAAYTLVDAQLGGLAGFTAGLAGISAVEYAGAKAFGAASSSALQQVRDLGRATRGMMVMYGAAQLIFGTIGGALFEDLSFGIGDEDDDETNFGRIRISDLVIDPSGGYGAFYRAILRMKEAGKEPNFAIGKPSDVAADFVLADRLHPSLNVAQSIITGRDFRNRPIAPSGLEVGPFNLSQESVSHLMALGNALPITFQQGLDYFLEGAFESDGDFMEGVSVLAQEAGSALPVIILSGLGINTYKLDTELQKAKYRELPERIGYKDWSWPNITYPKILNTEGKIEYERNVDGNRLYIPRGTSFTSTEVFKKNMTMEVLKANYKILYENEFAKMLDELPEEMIRAVEDNVARRENSQAAKKLRWNVLMNGSSKYNVRGLKEYFKDMYQYRVDEEFFSDPEVINMINSMPLSEEFMLSQQY